MKHYVLVSLFTFLTAIPSHGANNVPIIEFSIPKAGTHLLARTIHLITQKKLFFPGRIVSEKELEQHIDHLSSRHFLVAHQSYSQNLEHFIKQHNGHLLVMYRDPRDLIVSLAYFIYKYPDLWPTLQSLSMDDLISYLIVDHNYADRGLSIYTTATKLHGINAYYRAFMPWLASELSPCIVCFEELVGERGGSNSELQREAIYRIAHYLGYSLDETKLNTVINQMFGGTFSFREGKIGEWKRHFNQSHKELFKQFAGQLLIDLGYEEHFDW